MPGWCDPAWYNIGNSLKGSLQPIGNPVTVGEVIGFTLDTSAGVVSQGLPAKYDIVVIESVVQ